MTRGTQCRQTKSKTQTHQAVRKVAKQPHTRIRTKKFTIFDPTQAAADLIRSSVRRSSTRTYVSALNTLVHFVTWLRQTRGDRALPVTPEAITKEEFIQFLANCKAQGRRTIEPIRSALLQAQRATGRKCWTEAKDIRKMCLGVTASLQKSQKGAVTEAMMKQLASWIQQQDVNQCAACMHLSKKQRRCQVVLAAKLQRAQGMRPAQIRHLRYNDIQAPLIILRQKVKGPHLQERMRSAAVAALADDAKKAHFGTNSFVFTRCVEKHVGQILREAAVALGWSPKLIWTCHSMRHGYMHEIREKISQTTTKAMAGITRQTFVGFYALSNSEREATITAKKKRVRKTIKHGSKKQSRKRQMPKKE